MSDVTLSPRALPQNAIERGSPKPERGLSAFHTFEAQKEEAGSSKNRLIAGVAVAVMLAAAIGYSYEASHSIVPAKPAPQQSDIIATTPPATSPPAPADNMSAPAPENTPAANMTAPATAPPIVTAPVAPRAGHARVTHNVVTHNVVTHNAPARGTGGADSAMQARMSHTSDAPANITPPASQALTPDAIAPAPSQTVTPTAGSASTPVPVQAAPTATPPTTTPATQNPNTQNQTTPSDDPATN
jgi:hypothetical protein